jgi:hypothetical protein
MSIKYWPPYRFLSRSTSCGTITRSKKINAFWKTYFGQLHSLVVMISYVSYSLIWEEMYSDILNFSREETFPRGAKKLFRLKYKTWEVDVLLQSNSHIVTYWGCCVTYKTGLSVVIWYIAPYTYTQLGTTGNTALSLIYTLYSSPLLTQ